MTMTQIEGLLRGMCSGETLLDLVRHFIVFEQERNNLLKKLAAYHQYHAVNKAIQTTIKEEPANKRYVLKTLAAALPASQPYLLWFGLRKDFWGTTPLPLDLTGYGGPGCSIYVDLTLPLAGTTNASGAVLTYYTTNPITFPNKPAYQGIPFFLQWWPQHPLSKPQ